MSMVPRIAVQAHNAQLRGALGDYRHVSLFVGATRGIGLATVTELLRRVSQPTVYIVCRSKTRFARTLEQLRALNPDSHIIPIEGEASLLRDVDHMCEKLTRLESRLDLLFLSAGLLPSNSADNTPEYLDLNLTLSYYSRIRFIVNLLPLLQCASARNSTRTLVGHSPHSRVVSVLNGGNEKRLVLHDIGLTENYSFGNVIDQSTMLNTLVLDSLSKKYPDIEFIHEHPGVVRTDIISNFLSVRDQEFSSSFLWACFKWLSIVILRAILLPLFYAIAMSPQESGERRLYEATCLLPGRDSDILHKNDSPGIEPHVYLINGQSDLVSKDRVLRGYLDPDIVNQLWDHTMDVFNSATNSCS